MLFNTNQTKIGVLLFPIFFLALVGHAQNVSFPFPIKQEVGLSFARSVVLTPDAIFILGRGNLGLVKLDGEGNVQVRFDPEACFPGIAWQPQKLIPYNDSTLLLTHIYPNLLKLNHELECISTHMNRSPVAELILTSDSTYLGYLVGQREPFIVTGILEERDMINQNRMANWKSRLPFLDGMWQGGGMIHLSVWSVFLPPISQTLFLISTDAKTTKTLDLSLSPSTDTYPERRANDELQAFQSFRNLTEEGYLLNNGLFKIDPQSFAVTFSGKQGYTYKIFHDFSESYVHDDYLPDPIIWVDHEASYTLRADSGAANGIDWWIDKHVHR